MTDQEIDKWVEEHLKCPREGVLRVDYERLSDVLLRWGKNIAKTFYWLGKSEIPINLNLAEHQEKNHSSNT